LLNIDRKEEYFLKSCKQKSHTHTFHKKYNFTTVLRFSSFETK